MSIGTKIRDARLAMNLTQDELAKRIGVSKNAISNYENGVSTPKVELLCAIMKNLHVDANYIYDVSDSSRSLIPLSPHERQVLISYRAHPEAQPFVDKLLGVEAVADELVKRA